MLEASADLKPDISPVPSYSTTDKNTNITESAIVADTEAGGHHKDVKASTGIKTIEDTRSNGGTTNEQITTADNVPGESETHVLVLPFTSRTISYATYGQPSDSTLFVFHSLTGSRYDAKYFSTLASQHSVRVIGVDRPGYGMSSFDASRSIRDYATDILALADHLSIPRFRVLGVGKGGAYALSCAMSIPPDRLVATGVYQGFGPIYQTGITGMGLDFRALTSWTAFAKTPALARWIGRRMISQSKATPAKIEEKIRAGISRIPNSTMRASYEAQAETAVLSTSEAFRQGPEGYLADMALLAKDWRFRIEEVPRDRWVLMWYGTHDRKAPLKMGKWITRRLGGREEPYMGGGLFQEQNPVEHSRTRLWVCEGQDGSGLLWDQLREQVFKCLMDIP